MSLHSDPETPSRASVAHIDYDDKQPAAVLENPDVRKMSESDDDSFGFSVAHQRRIIRLVDLRLVLTVGVMYCINLMDRTNMAAANIAGMAKELKLVGNNHYNVANLVFFISYILFNPLAGPMVRTLGARVHLSAIILFWGIVMIGMGFVNNWGQLSGLRVILGLLESGFFPACVYLLSTWYTRYEVGKRYSLFYSIGYAIQSFSGILAYGLMHLAGRDGLSGWRWIFIVEGIMTCAVGIAGYFLLVDFPDSKRKVLKFLSLEERQWIVARVHRDRGDTRVPPFNLGSFLRGGLDWRIYAYGMIFFCATTISYALAYTLPILLVQNMHFDIGTAQCLVAPPAVFSGLYTIVMGWVGDRYRLRGPVIIFNSVVSIVGLAVTGWSSTNAVRYFGVFLITAGATSSIPTSMAYQANNIRGQWKRAFCSATLVGLGAIGGIAGSLVFRDQDKLTGYKPGMYACIACGVLSIILVCIVDFSLWLENKKADRGEKVLEPHDDNACPNFRYTY